MSLDVDSGDINWVWQSESNATVFGTGGVVLAEDGSPIVGGIAFGNLFNLSYEYWEVCANIAWISVLKSICGVLSNNFL